MEAIDGIDWGIGAVPLAPVCAVNQDLELFAVNVGLAGGLALFLFGMGQLASGLKAVVGGRMRTLLARLTGNRFTGAATGAVVTAVIQSSSVTTVLVVGFVSAGLMTLKQSVGVIMGANIGTTVTAQVIAFKVADAALLIVAVGFAFLFLGRRETVKQAGTAVLGLGLVFLGMVIMGDAVAPLHHHPPFVEFMAGLDNSVLGILAGAVFTVMVQSSSATTGLVIVLAGSGLISLPAGIALILGANVGTCVTALLATIGRPRAAVRAAAAHVVFNLAGAALWVGFIDQLAGIAVALSPVAEGLTGAARLAAEAPRQIANAHTVFNVSNALVFIGLTGPIAALVARIVPSRSESAGVFVRPRYLDDRRLDENIAVADSTRRVIGEIHGAVGEALDGAIAAAAGDRDAALRVIAMKPRINALAAEAVRRGAQRLVAQESDRLSAYAREMEMIEKLKRIYYFAKRIAKTTVPHAEDEGPEVTHAAGNGEGEGEG